MKRLWLLLIFLASIQLVEAVLIEVNVIEKLDAKFTSVAYKTRLNLVEMDAELYNIGSIPYKARMRLDIFNASERIFTGWSKEKTLYPGDREVFTLYFYTNLTGNLTVKLRAYFGNEWREHTFTIENNMSYAPIDAIEVKNVRVYERFAVLELKAKEDVGKLLVIPKDFPLTWIVEQGSVGNMNRGDVKRYYVQYISDVWVKDRMTLLLVSEDGRYATEVTFTLEKERGILGFVRYLVDMFLYKLICLS